MRRLAIIDPDPAIREALRAVFSTGYALSLAPTFSEAVARAEADLLILGLPPARSAAQALLEDLPEGLPVLALSVAPFEYEGVDILAKPFNVDEIRAKVAGLLESRPRRKGAPASGPPVNLEEAVSAFERGLIVEALEKTGGVQIRAAEMLGTTRRILRYRMDKLGIPVPRKQS